MKYLFTTGTVFDRAGIAMIKGSMNGILKLDSEAKFSALVMERHSKNNPVCPIFIHPTQIKDAFNWADAICDVGGLATNSKLTKTYVKEAKHRDKPYIWMSVSFHQNITKEQLEGTLIAARGKNSATHVKDVIGTFPEISADMSFLIEPIPYTGQKYTTGFTTHHNKPFQHMHKLCKTELRPIQIIWKTYRLKYWEPELNIDKFCGSVEETFGIIASLDMIHTARYHSAVAAIHAGKTKDQIKLYINYKRKYDDLINLVGTPLEELKRSAMIPCELAVNAVKGKTK